MSTPTRTDPPHVPLRHGGWPAQKAPRWLLVAGAVVLAGAVLTGLAHHPTRSHGAARAAARAKLQRDLRRLDGQRAYLNKIMMNAVEATSATGKLPPLPG